MPEGGALQTAEPLSDSGGATAPPPALERVEQPGTQQNVRMMFHLSVSDEGRRSHAHRAEATPAWQKPRPPGRRSQRGSSSYFWKLPSTNSLSARVCWEQKQELLCKREHLHFQPEAQIPAEEPGDRLHAANVRNTKPRAQPSHVRSAAAAFQPAWLRSGTCGDFCPHGGSLNATRVHRLS